MYKVMIVDDEVLVRVGLKTTIDWEAIGFTIVAEAANGEQGYENYLKYKPDVIITDIKMPKQDGLWLVEKVQKENADAKILVLTCYDEFSFARKALKGGAYDYILKSEVEDEELIKLMVSLKEKMDKQNKEKTGKNVKSNIEDLKPSVVSGLIKEGFQMDERLLKLLSELDFPTTNSAYAYLSISIHHSLEAQTDMAKINYAVMNILYEQFKQYAISYIDIQQSNQYLLFISSPGLKTADIKKTFASAANGAVQYFNVSLNAVYSEVFNQIEQVGNIYKEFTDKAQVLFYKLNKSNRITQMDAINFKESNVFDLKIAYNMNFIEAIGHEDFDKVKELTREIGENFENEYVSPMIVKIFYSNLIGDLFSSYGLFLSNREIFETHKTYHYQIERSDQLRNINKLLIDFSGNLIKEIQNIRYHNSKSLINQALNFIKYHYTEKISLDDVAEELSVSKHYLSSIFKKETGENMSLYINKLRIETAKQLLLESDIKIKEVFEKAGYSDQQYFSKVFKKITGLTVIEYKEGMGRK
ncbi:MAG: response regulator [Anaerocolumna sp.]